MRRMHAAKEDPRSESSLDERQDPTLARVGAFSDGVFAFAATLLVLSIRIPHPSDADANRGLLALMLGQWRSVVVYLVSFMLVGMNWANFRVVFASLTRATHLLIWIIMIYLMVGVAFVPLPTAVLGEWIGDPKNQVVATVFYGLCVTVGGSIYCLMWWYAAYAANLTDLSHEERRSHTAAYAPAPFLCAILTGVAFLSPWAAVCGFAVIIFLYILPMPRLIAKKHQRWSS